MILLKLQDLNANKSFRYKQSHDFARTSADTGIKPKKFLPFSSSFQPSQRDLVNQYPFFLFQDLSVCLHFTHASGYFQFSLSS